MVSITYVDMVDDGINLGHLLRRIGNHVDLPSGHSNRQLLVANSVLNLLQEQRVLVNLLNLLVIRNLPVVLA